MNIKAKKTYRKLAGGALAVGLALGGLGFTAAPAAAEGISKTRNGGTGIDYRYTDWNNKFCIWKTSDTKGYFARVEVKSSSGRTYIAIDRNTNAFGSCVYLEAKHNPEGYQFKFTLQAMKDGGHVAASSTGYGYR